MFHNGFSSNKTSVCALIFTDGAWQLREGVVGEEEVLQILAAADLLVYHLQVVLGHVEVYQLF